MKHYCTKTDEVLKHLNATEGGLTTEEASKRLEANGKNRLVEAKGKSIFRRFMEQLADPMILILLAAAAISGVLAVMEGEGFADVIIILAVVLINAVLGVYQESKAEKAIEALQEMSAATSKVLRDGKIQIVHSEDLVVGDIVLLEAGVLPEHLAVTNLCTCCNHEELFSHRASKGKRGNLAAFLSIMTEADNGE